jgi:hypothetical protein
MHRHRMVSLSLSLFRVPILLSVLCVFFSLSLSLGYMAPLIKVVVTHRQYRIVKKTSYLQHDFFFVFCLFTFPLS